jgi:hypothetical protein
MSCASGECNCEGALKAITEKLDAIDARFDAMEGSMRDQAATTDAKLDAMAGSMRDHAAATDAKLDAIDAKLDGKLDAMEQRMIGKLETLILFAIGQSRTSAIAPGHQRTDATVARHEHDAAETGDADDGPAAAASPHGGGVANSDATIVENTTVGSAPTDATPSGGSDRTSTTD